MGLAPVHSCFYEELFSSCDFGDGVWELSCRSLGQSNRAGIEAARLEATFGNKVFYRD